MPQPTPNCTVDLYRGFNPANPYAPPSAPAAAAGLAGVLRPHVRHGRFGRAALLHWTNVLLLPAGTDIRSAYDSQRNALDVRRADTVLAPNYPRPGVCTAFLVVLVQASERGQADAPLRCYLDRARPRLGGCAGGASVPCCAEALPDVLHATFSDIAGCAALQGLSVPLHAFGGEWVSGAFDLCFLCARARLHFACAGGDCTGFRLTLDPPAPCAGVVGPFAPTDCGCAPLAVEFVLGAAAPFACCSGPAARFRVTVTE